MMIHPAIVEKKRKGAAAVEFAVCLPLLCLLFLGAVDFARALYAAITLENCTHNGAIYGSQVFDNQNQQWISGQAQYWQGPNGQMLSTEQAAADVDGTNLSPALGSSNVTVATGTDADGHPVNIITVTYTFGFISSWFPSLTIQRQLQVRIAPSVPN